MKKYLFIIVVFLLIIIGVIGANWFMHTESYISFFNWVQQYKVPYSITLFLIKYIGIIWPPIPGGVATIGSIPLLGWFNAWMIDTAGSVLGGVTAFAIARRYGKKIVVKINGESALHILSKIKIRSRNEFEFILILRIFGGSVADIISYALGLTTVKYKNYILATITSSIVVSMPAFYIFNGVLLGKNLVIFSVVGLVVAILMYIFRDRYLDLSDESNGDKKNE